MERAPRADRGGWIGGALTIALLLLGSVWLVARVAEPDISLFFLGTLDRPDLGQVLHVLMAPPACCSSACSRTRCPSSWRSSCRWRPG